MSIPFTEKFFVGRSWLAKERFIVWVNSTLNNLSGNIGRDWQTDVRRFIESAIREKLEREKAKP